MANQIKIQRFKEGTLCEIYQDVDTKFAFVSDAKDGYRQCHSLAKCRDFLQDGIRAQLTGEQVSIYGFSYKSGTNPPIDFKKTRMLVKKADFVNNEDFKTEMGRAKKLLVHYERIAGWSETKVLRVEGDPGLRVFVSPPNWMLAPHLISMYTLLIRLGAYKASYRGLSKEETFRERFAQLLKDYDGKGKSGRLPIDVKYLGKIYERLEIVVAKCDKLISEKIEENYPNVGINALHNRSGIVSLCNGSHCDKELLKRFKELTCSTE